MKKNILIIGTGHSDSTAIQISRQLSARVGVSVTVHEMEKTTENFYDIINNSITSFQKLSKVMAEIKVEEVPEKKSRYINKPRNNFKR